uniref:Uncharacterized protein n=1 Tax=Marseillevirus LCMAC103 TaxID=2506604 RepID=A0A481YWD7_9VIRU|nr:MAG: hypothetical protein LCMAC103_01740 [Marseillevirus LCMAC103]
MPTIIVFTIVPQDGKTYVETVEEIREQLRDENSVLRKNFPDIDLDFGIQLVTERELVADMGVRKYAQGRARGIVSNAQRWWSSWWASSAN